MISALKELAKSVQQTEGIDSVVIFLHDEAKRTDPKVSYYERFDFTTEHNHLVSDFV